MVEGLRSILEGKAAPMPKPPAAPVLYKTWQTSGIGATMDQWKSMQTSAVYDTRVGELESLASGLLGKGKANDALTVAKVAEEMAPKSPNVEVLMARAQAATGHRVEAITAYSKAITLSTTPRAFPTLTEAIRQLADPTEKK